MYVVTSPGQRTILCFGFFSRHGHQRNSLSTTETQISAKENFVVGEEDREIPGYKTRSKRAAAD